MKFLKRLNQALESRWVTPAYSGWLMGGLAIFFFGAATNTMAGWLYVMSGLMVAIAGIGAVLPWYTLRGLKLRQQPIMPVSAGEALRIELAIENPTPQPKTLLQLQAQLPAPLPPLRTVIEQVPAQGQECWTAILPVMQRGIYRWRSVEIRTAAPLGLFWCRRSHPVQARAIVYPQVLPLSQCPIVDEMGQQTHQTVSSLYRSQLAPEGLARGLRPYRWGDSMRLIHWRSSARYGELRVRELETYNGGQELVVALDGSGWQTDCFEQAVIAAASIYFYALRQQRPVSLWTPLTDRIQGEQRVLEALAGIQPQISEASAIARPRSPVLWLTQSASSLTDLPAGSHWLLWLPQPRSLDRLASTSGLPIMLDQPLQIQLQQPLQQQPLQPSSTLLSGRT